MWPHPPAASGPALAADKAQSCHHSLSASASKGAPQLSD